MKKSLILSILIAILCFIQAQDIKIACVGNSITAYMATYPIIDQDSYPVQLDILLGEGYDVRNFGRSGRTLLKNGDFPIWVEDAFYGALDFNPDIVTILLGTNDSKPQNWGPYGETEFYADYAAMIDTFRSLGSDPEIYTCLPPPAFSSKYDINDSVIYNAIIPKIQQVAIDSQTNVIDFYTYFSDKAYLSYDGIHPTLDGNWEYAKVICEELTGNTVKKIQDVNLALHKTITPLASVQASENAVDGNRRTIWACTKGESFTIDLTETDSVDMIQVIFNESACYQYTIETSTDNSTWDLTVDQSSNQDSILFTIDATGVIEPQYLRFTINSPDEIIDSIRIAEVCILKAAPVHAPVVSYIYSKQTTARVYYTLVITSCINGGALRYYQSDSLEVPFEGASGYRISDTTIIQNRNVNKELQKYYFASYYKDLYEVSSDTLVIDFSLFEHITDINEEPPSIPAGFCLNQNYPNPFNPLTKISYHIPESDYVILKIYDILGREVQTLVDKFQKAGDYTINFDGKNLASGIYFYQLNVGKSSKGSKPDYTETKKMVLMR